MRLYDLNIGNKARILEIHRGWGAQRRLMDLGLLPGTKIEMVAKSPFGGHVLLKVGGSHVALSRGWAQAIVVELLTTD